MGWRPRARCSPPSWAASPSAQPRAAASASEWIRRQALRGYAVLEAGIAAIALALPWLLLALRPVLAALYDNGAAGLAFSTARLVSSLVLLSLPAAAMGATFPLASRWLVRSAPRVPEEAGRLYAANTLGAAAGAVVTGFVLLPSLGLTGATIVGVALNLAAAGGAWWLAARVDGTAAPAVPAQDGKSKDAPHRTIRTSLAGGRGAGRHRVRLAGPASGLDTAPRVDARAYHLRVQRGGRDLHSRHRQRLGTRRRGCRAGSRGRSRPWAWPSPRARRWPWRRRRPSIPVLLAVAEVVARPEATFEQVVAREWAFTAAILLPMAIAFGAAFPFALSVAARDESSMVADLGVVYAVNTAGAIAGALGAGFVLVPWLGLYETIRLVAVLMALCAIGLSLAARPRPAWGPLALGLAVGSAAWVVPEWDPRLLSSGAYKYARSLRGPDLVTALTAGELQYHREGSTATVAVRRLTGTTSLSIDGKVDASDAADMLTQRLLAHVPLLLHPSPQRAAILGLGSGVTLGSALTHGLDARGGAGDLPRGRRSLTLLRPREPSAARGPADPARGRRRPHPSPAGRRALRRHRVRAIQSVDGRHRLALHTRVLRDREGAAGAGRRAVPVGAHLRHQRRRSALDRGDVSLRVPRWDTVARRRGRRAPGGLDRAAGRASGRHRHRLEATWGERRPGLGGRPIATGGALGVRRRRSVAESMGRRRAHSDRRPCPAGVLGPAQRLRRREGRQRAGSAGSGGGLPAPGRRDPGRRRGIG